jgi:hypothetical protein
MAIAAPAPMIRRWLRIRETSTIAYNLCSDALASEEDEIAFRNRSRGRRRHREIYIDNSDPLSVNQKQR